MGKRTQRARILDQKIEMNVREPQKNILSLHEAVTCITARKPLKLSEIVTRLAKLKYRFNTDDPLQEVEAYLASVEGRRRFRRTSGRFSPA